MGSLRKIYNIVTIMNLGPQMQSCLLNYEYLLSIIINVRIVKFNSHEMLSSEQSNRSYSKSDITVLFI